MKHMSIVVIFQSKIVFVMLPIYEIQLNIISNKLNTQDGRIYPIVALYYYANCHINSKSIARRTESYYLIVK